MSRIFQPVLLASFGVAAIFAASGFARFGLNDTRARLPRIDQEQVVYNGGLSARTRVGHCVWQSFTVSRSGLLVQIDAGFFNDMTGSSRLDVIEGDEPAGRVLQSLTVQVDGKTQRGVTWNTWRVCVPVSAGQRYMFRLTPDADKLPDPFGVALGEHNPYAGGRLGISDPSGDHRTESDWVFRTHVR